jgi:hypothetical protein
MTTWVPLGKKYSANKLKKYISAAKVDGVSLAALTEKEGVKKQMGKYQKRADLENLDEKHRQYDMPTHGLNIDIPQCSECYTCNKKFSCQDSPLNDTTENDIKNMRNSPYRERIKRRKL